MSSSTSPAPQSPGYTVHVLDAPGHSLIISEHEKTSEGRREAEDSARRESLRQPLPVEVCLETKWGPTVLRRYVDGVLT